MATRHKYRQSTEERRRRRFGEEFKKKKVREIEQKITTIAEVSRQYEVRANNVSKWLSKFGTQQSNKGIRVIVESESDTRKLLQYKKKVAELEQIIGQKQVLLDFKDKMIELAEDEYGIDIKKKYGKRPCSTSGSTGRNSQ